jgi:hypothetical protein
MKKNDDEEITFVTFALVCRSNIDDIDKIKKYIINLDNTSIIYQKTSVVPLIISEQM